MSWKKYRGTLSEYKNYNTNTYFFLESSNPERQMCQAGFSAGISADGNVVSMGLPGYKGTVHRDVFLLTVLQ